MKKRFLAICFCIVMIFGIGFVSDIETEAGDIQEKEAEALVNEEQKSVADGEGTDDSRVQEMEEEKDTPELPDKLDEDVKLEESGENVENSLMEQEAADSMQKQEARDSVDMKSFGSTSKPVIEKVCYDFENSEYSTSDYFEGELTVKMSGDPDIERYVYSSNRTDFDGSDYTGYNWTDNFWLFGIPAYASDTWYVWAVDSDGNVSDMYTLKKEGFSREYYGDRQLPIENPGNIGSAYFDDEWRGKDEHALEVFIDEKGEKRLIEGEDYTQTSFIDNKGNIVYVITGKGKYYGTIIRTFDKGYPYKTMEEIIQGFTEDGSEIVKLTEEPNIEKKYRINENGWWGIDFYRCLAITFPKIGSADSGVAGYYVSHDGGETWLEPPMNTYINDGTHELHVGPDDRNGENLKFSYMFAYECWEEDKGKVYITEPSEPMIYKRDSLSPVIRRAVYDGKGHILVEATDNLSGLWKYACSQKEENLFYYPSRYATGENSSIPVSTNGKWYVSVCDKANHWADPVEVEVSGLGGEGKTEGSENLTDTPAGDNKNIKVSAITLSGVSKKIAAGKKIKLAAKVIPFNATNKAVTWMSSNTKVATVNKSGVVTMNKKSGGKSVTITATAQDGSGVKAAYKITSMKGVVKKVTVSGKKTVKVGKTLKLKGKVTATKKANKKLKWTSSNKKYATVSNSGKVKALKAGKGKKVKITAMATDGSGKKKSVTIKIK